MIVLGLGSNIGDREQNITAAITALAEHPAITVRKVSSLYNTAPVGVTEQPEFLNVVIILDTTLSPLDLLDVCLNTEQQLGRIRNERWGPRNIDIDILIYNDVKCQSDKLTLPHPRFHERCFVLVPLNEIAQGVPVYEGLTSGELLAKCDLMDVKFYKKLAWE